MCEGVSGVNCVLSHLSSLISHLSSHLSSFISSFISHLSSLISSLLSDVSCLISHVSSLIYHVSCLISLFWFDCLEESVLSLTQTITSHVLQIPRCWTRPCRCFQPARDPHCALQLIARLAHFAWPDAVDSKQTDHVPILMNINDLELGRSSSLISCYRLIHHSHHPNH